MLDRRGGGWETGSKARTGPLNGDGLRAEERNDDDDDDEKSRKLKCVEHALALLQELQDRVVGLENL